jgi:hypothetical protein
MKRLPAAVALVLPLAHATLPLLAQDCAWPGLPDPDGRTRRREASRATVAFAVSHPHAVAAAGTEAAPAARPSKVAADGSLSGARRRSRHDGYVDEEIFGKMEADRVAPAPESTDTEFLRRVTLDLTGRIPDADTVVAFVADPSPDKRSRMVDALLTSDGFVDRWGLFYGDLFLSTAYSVNGRLWPAGRDAYHAYFRDSISSRKPWDVMARELIAATGVNQTNGAANYLARQTQSNGPMQDTYDNLAAFTAATFLGMNAVFCTSCHNGAAHLDLINLWGSTVRRQDFWGMSAFFSRVTVSSSGFAPNSFYTVGDRATGDYPLNTKTGNKTDRTGAYYTTAPPGLGAITPAYLRTPLNPAGGAPLPGETYRQALSRLVTSDPQFARAAVNYLWREMFKVGIVEPADGFDPMRQDPASPPPGAWTIQPTHPALLAKLAEDYAARGYDLRYILGVMAKSRAYQLSSFYPGTWSEAYTRYFARHFAQRLLAEEIFDAIVKATNVPLGVVAMQLPDTTEPVVDLNGRLLAPFLRGNRDGTPRVNAFSVPQALNMLNNNQITIRCKNVNGSAVSRLVASNATPEQVVNALFLQTLSRYPTPAEKAMCLSKFTAGTTTVSFANNLQYVLLQKLDFLYNY